MSKPCIIYYGKSIQKILTNHSLLFGLSRKVFAGISPRFCLRVSTVWGRSCPCQEEIGVNVARQVSSVKVGGNERAAMSALALRFLTEPSVANTAKNLRFLWIASLCRYLSCKVGNTSFNILMMRPSYLFQSVPCNAAISCISDLVGTLLHPVRQ